MNLGGFLVAVGCFALLAFTGVTHLHPNQRDGNQVANSGELLLPRYGPSAVSDGNWVYVFGGSPNGGRNGKDFMHAGLHSSIERINPKTLQSEYYSNGLHRRANHVSVFWGDKLVTCGGRSQVGVLRPKMVSCEYLEMGTGLFREMPPLPVAIRTLGMAEVDGALYVVGGVMDGAFSKATFRLKRDDDKWEELANAPLEVSGQIIAVGSKIYAIGGYNGKTMASVMVFDTKLGQWSRMQDLPYGLSAYSAVTDGEAIFIFGDYVQQDVIHRFDPKTGQLHLLDKKMTPRRHTAAVVVDDRAIVIGGNQTSAGMALKTIEAFDLETLRNGGRLMTKKN